MKPVKILIVGAAGMIGRKTVAALAAEPVVAGREVGSVCLHDAIEPDIAQFGSLPFEVVAKGGDLSMSGVADDLVSSRPDVIIHLAAIVSGEAEEDFDKGYRVNLLGTQNLLTAVRQIGLVPRFVFTSSIAAFGAPFPERIGDEFHLTPLTSYGTQKAICELLLADYTRKGFIDGVGIRLPTIVVRPGTPNKAASGFFSNIIREPLAGKPAVLPVAGSVRLWAASPRAAAGFVLHAAGLDGEQIGPRRNLTMPGVGTSVDDMIAALQRVAGADAAKRIERRPDPFIERIVSGWPHTFDAARATRLGFRADQTFEDIIRNHIEDELGGKFAQAGLPFTRS